MSDEVKIPLPRSLQEIVGALLFASETPLTANEIRDAIRAVEPVDGDNSEILECLCVGRPSWDHTMVRLFPVRMSNCRDGKLKAFLSRLCVSWRMIGVVVDVIEKTFAESKPFAGRIAHVEPLGERVSRIRLRHHGWICGRRDHLLHQIAVLVVRVRASGVADEAAVLWTLLRHFDIISS